jgi:hypothetical protein
MQILVIPVVLYGCGTGLYTLMEGCRQAVLTLLHQNTILVNAHCDSVKTECHLKSSAMNTLSNAWLCKSLGLVQSTLGT